ncbi:MAG: DegT/DnrJ/EryC1/StrS family aminotransferase [Spirochaetes bacterium]|nr:DegT/DnrJ/EryC1/StrS family aminotransferase [Spirochaetota bacterium]
MSKLAINGGKPVRKKPFFPWPYHSQEEVNAVVRVAKSGKWQSRWHGADDVTEFERAFARYQQAEYGVCVNNGTVTMMIALQCFGIGPGDEVLMPVSTFIAVPLAVLQLNAVPVFIDIEPGHGNIDPAKLEDAITPRTKAVIVVHNYGIPADMDAVLAIARKNKLHVLEDAAHAHGSEWRGKRVGAIGDMGSFSFQSGKVMTSGDGGILLTNNEKLYKLAKGISSFGYGYPEPILACNYRISEFQAAVLRVQFKRLDSQIDRRWKNYQYLSKRLDEIDGINIPAMDERVTRWSVYVLFARYNRDAFEGVSKQRFVEAVKAEGIEIISDGYTPLYRNPLFQNKTFMSKNCSAGQPWYDRIDYTKVHCPVAEHMADESAFDMDLYNFLLGPTSDIDDVIDAISKVKENISEIK